MKADIKTIWIMLNLTKQVLLQVYLTSNESWGKHGLEVRKKDGRYVCSYIIPTKKNVNNTFYGYETINNCQ